MADLSDEVAVLFDRYLRCWNDRDLDGVAGCFTEPALFVTPGVTIPLSDRAALVAMLRKLFDGLEQAGFSHTTLGTPVVRRHAATLALVDLPEVCRWKEDGTLLEEIDAHYVLRDTDEGWRLAVAVASDPR